MRIGLILLVSCFGASAFAQEKALNSVVCVLGNAAATEGPGFLNLEGTRNTKSKTTSTLYLGEGKGFYAQTLTVTFRFGYQMNPDELRNAAKDRFGENADERLETFYKENPSAIDFQVTGTLAQNSVKLRIERELTPFDNRIGVIIIDHNPREIEVKRSQFGLPIVVGDVGIVCNGK